MDKNKKKQKNVEFFIRSSNKRYIPRKTNIQNKALKKIYLLKA